MTQEEKNIQKAERAYFKKICGFEYSEVKTTDEYDENGHLIKRKKETSKKRVLPDSGALYEYLCKSAPEKWAAANQSAEEKGAYGVVMLPEVKENE